MQTSRSGQRRHSSGLGTDIVLVHTLKPGNEEMGTFGNNLVLDTSNTVVNDTTVTRINYTTLGREMDTKQQLTIVKRFVTEPDHNTTANRPLQHLSNNIHSLRHLIKR